MAADKSVHRNLDAQSRRLREVEITLAALLGDDSDQVTYAAPITMEPGPLNYDVLTAANERLRVARGWGEPDLEAALSSELREQLREWQARQRTPWQRSDFATVGLAALVGAIASFFDDQIDQVVREGLGWLKGTDTVQGWENAGKGMPIDYTGPEFGGPGHRIRSAGHDVARPFAALRQIRSGMFEGTFWEDQAQQTAKVGGYTAIPGFVDAIMAWFHHLAADVITPMSLPLPGWTLLYELPNREIRKFAHQAYDGMPGKMPGANVRTMMLTPMLSTLAVELILRAKVHTDAFKSSRRWTLTVAEKSKLQEMLMVGHGLSSAASVSKAVLLSEFEGPAALRHVNMTSIVRTGGAGWRVFNDKRRRNNLAPPTWETLLTGQLNTAQQDSLTALEHLCAVGPDPA